MALTVAQVAQLPELGLILRTNTAALDRTVRWVAVSELANPAPWLDGGELLLTTGMSVSHDQKAMEHYVRNLVDADVAALGFGVGIGHPEIPEPLLAAAESAGLPVLEIPQPVPFVAIGKAVLRMLTADDFAESAASFQSQRSLIKSALEDDPERLEARVAGVVGRHVGGFALVLGASGVAKAAYPKVARSRAEALRGEIDRLRPKGVLASSAVVTENEHVVIVPIGTGKAASGFLVVGCQQALPAADQAVVNLAVSVLSWHSSRPGGLSGDPRAWRTLALQACETMGVQESVLAALGLPALAREARGIFIRGESAFEGMRLLEAAGECLLRKVSESSVRGILAGVDDQTLLSIAALPGIDSVGLSRPQQLDSPDAVRLAGREAERAAYSGRGMRIAGDEPHAGFAALVEPHAARSWARGYLGGLMAVTEGPELRETLHCWLARNGQVDAAAGDLGVHRHTVRHRLRRIEALLGVDLSEADVRANLWLALSAVED